MDHECDRQTDRQNRPLATACYNSIRHMLKDDCMDAKHNQNIIHIHIQHSHTKQFQNNCYYVTVLSAIKLTDRLIATRATGVTDIASFC